MKNKKRVLRLFIEIIFTIIIVFGLMLLNDKINLDQKREFRLVDDSRSYAYQIESVNTEGDDFVIEGWFFELKSVHNVAKEIKEDKELGIVLYDISSKSKKETEKENIYNKGIALNVYKKTRADVNEYFKCEYDYSKCGFEARINKSEIDLIDGKYQVIIKPDYEQDIGIGINAYIDNGILKFVDSEEEMSLDVTGTDLEVIVEDGYCLASNLEYSISVYQYKDELYWIADTGYYFEEDGGTYIQYQLDTTQFQKLPADRKDNGWFWSNIGGDFEIYEVTSKMNCGKYRVSSRKIPKEYSVTQIETGYFADGKWTWQSTFKPVYLYLFQK